MESLREIVRKVWGYDEFRPLQGEAIEAVLAGRDSVVVLPTGGGKSLCFQAPALAMPGTAVVVSPLIALMQDQVDALARTFGVPAGALLSELASTLDPARTKGEHDLLAAYRALNTRQQGALLEVARSMAKPKP